VLAASEIRFFSKVASATITSILQEVSWSEINFHDFFVQVKQERFV